MSSFINISRQGVTPLVAGITGIGATTVYFNKKSTPASIPGEPGCFIFGLLNVVGSFSSTTTVNLEYTPTIGTGAYWETVQTWAPFLQTQMVAPCAESGFYRLNVTVFAGGTSFDVWATIGNGSAASGSSSGLSENANIFDSSGNALNSNGSGALQVAVVSGGGTNASVGLTGATAPTSATEIGSVDRTGKLQVVTSDLRGTAQAIAVEIVDASGNQITSFGSSTVTADIVGHAGAVLDAVLGATKPPNVLQVGGNDGTNAYAVPLASGGASVVVSGSVSVSGSVTAAQGTAAALSAYWPVGLSDGTNLIGVSAHPVYVQGTVTANQGTAAANTAPWVTRPGSPTTASWTVAAINFNTSGANIIVAAVGGQTVRVMRMFFVNCDSTNVVNVTIQDTTPTSFTGPIRIITAGSFNGTDSNGEPLYVSASGKGIQLNTDTAVQISGTIWYTQS